MRAMTYRGPYKLRVEEKDKPRIEHPNDAIVRVQLAAICGSDLHLYQDRHEQRGRHPDRLRPRRRMSGPLHTTSVGGSNPSN
jgi:threonine dehydrogenase-like Zn-dependent dehydrogenase